METNSHFKIPLSNWFSLNTTLLHSNYISVGFNVLDGQMIIIRIYQMYWYTVSWQQREELDELLWFTGYFARFLPTDFQF